MMEFRGWLFFVLMTILLTMYLWATGCRVNGAPAPLPKVPPKLTNKMVEGAYSIALDKDLFAFALLPNGIYSANFGSSSWSGTWTLNPEKSRIDIKEWSEGSWWYGNDDQASRWHIHLKRDKEGKIIREGYIYIPR